MTYRLIDTGLWNDSWVENLDSNEKLLFVYLFTNTYCNQAGLMQFSIKRISFDTGIEPEKIEKSLSKFSDSGKIVIEGNKLACISFMKHQIRNGNFKKACQKHVELIEEGSLKQLLSNMFTSLKQPESNDEATPKQVKSNDKATPKQVESNDEAMPKQPESNQKECLNRIEQNRTEIKENTSSPKKNTFSDEQYLFAEKMLADVQRVSPRVKGDLKSWANTIRLIEEADNVPLSEIYKIFEWANNDGFWSRNILSPEKLRKQIPQLEAKMTAENRSEADDDQYAENERYLERLNRG